MTYSIPSDISRVDTNGDGKIDRLYVGDMGGRLWRFDVGDPDPANWTGKIIFKSNTGSSDRRKIFYPPDVVLEGEEWSELRDASLWDGGSRTSEGVDHDQSALCRQR